MLKERPGMLAIKQENTAKNGLCVIKNVNDYANLDMQEPPDTRQ